MAKFRYRMQNILDIKRKLESQARAAFSQANLKYMNEQDKLEELVFKRFQYEKMLKEQLSGKVNIRELRIARENVDTMKTLVRRQMMEVHKAEMTLEACRRELGEVVKERKTQEILRDKEFEEFKKELLRQESKEIDELVSYTYNPNEAKA